MYKNGLIFIALLIICCGETEKTKVVDDRPPNILFILVDDLGKEWISSYGAEDIVTPNIDKLAESGMQFNNVYSMPQCTPSRVSLLTGQYPFRHGWVNHWDVPRWGGGAHFDETVNPSLVNEIRRAGYKTCVAGKWQIDDFRVEPDALVKAGFDEFCMWTGYEAGVEPSSERYWKPYIFTKEGSKTYADAFGPDIFRDFIVRFIQENKDGPMFIYYPMVLTHTPFVNTPDASATDTLGKHKAMVRYTDKIVGELVQALEKNDLLNDTMIVFTTDNGTTKAITGSYKGQRVKGGKAGTAEAGICEPFIVSWPKKVKADQESDALIDFTDMLPTFIDIAGVTSKNKWTQSNASHIIDGKSFKNVLLGSATTSKRKWILGMGGGNNARLTEKGVENQYRFRDRVLRNAQYKLYVGTDRKPQKFFDLKLDPFEENNLLANEMNVRQTENLNALVAIIDSFPKMDNDPKYVPNPPQQWDVGKTSSASRTK